MSDDLATIAKLKAALATGVKRISVDGQDVTYNSPAEMERVLFRLESTCAHAPVARKRPVISSLRNTLRNQ